MNNDIYERYSKLSPAKQRLLETLRQKSVSAAAANRDDQQSRITRIPRDGALPLSFAQERMWVLHQFDPGSAAYNDHVAVRLKGHLDVAVLERALMEVVSRHEILRTTFPVVDGNPVQTIQSGAQIELKLIDLTSLMPGEREQRLHETARAEISSPFDLARGPLLRAHLVRTAPEDHTLILVLQHIIFDGWSRGILIQELTAFYSAFVTGRLPDVAELPVQYADFASWERSWLQGATLDSQIEYWKKRLGGEIPVLDLPADYLRPAAQTYRGANLTGSVSQEIRNTLEALSRNHQSTLFITLLAAFAVLLHRYSGLEDIIIGTPTANRKWIETERLIGVFVNTLALRIDLSGNPRFVELLDRVRNSALQAHAHQDVPFERLVELLMPQRDLSRNPFFQVMFERAIPVSPGQIQGLEVEGFNVHSGTSQFDMTLVVQDGPAGGLINSVDYSTDLFKAERIARMLEHFEILLRGIADDPQKPISDLPLLPPAERLLLTSGWNQTATVLPAKCMHELFEDQARRTPESIAVADGSRQLTYAELNLHADRWATYLLSAGAAREAKVAVCMRRSCDMLVALLAILKAGAVYLPLDPDYPQDRIDYIIKDAQPALVLTETGLRERVPASLATLLYIDQEIPALQEPTESVSARVELANAAYVIYTSGTTGRPKGVLLEHRGLVNHLWCKVRDLGLTQRDRIAQTASCAFDISLWQFLAGLLVGARIEVIGDEVAHDGSRLAEEVERLKISILQTVPTLMALILDHAQASTPKPLLSSLRWMISTGEPLPVSLAERWQMSYPGIPLLNAYGPTECSDDVTHCVVDAGQRAALKYALIGRPLCNTRAYVLDNEMGLVPIGVVGELYVGGRTVGRGYLNRPELTAQKFVPDVFGGEAGARLYRTGDRVRWLSDGNLEFLGRLDHQIKIRGFRIELAEIETRLAEHPSVGQVIVLPREDDPGQLRLVAYYTPAEKSAEPTDDGLGAAELRAHMLAVLPDYMVPAAYVRLEKFPLNTNGKIDRKALPAPQMDAFAVREYEAPEGEMETRIAAIWAELLNLEKVGRRDNFFALGGNSLLVVRLVERIRQAGFAVDVRALFTAPTLAELVHHLDAGAALVEVPENRIPAPIPEKERPSGELILRL